MTTDDEYDERFRRRQKRLRVVLIGVSLVAAISMAAPMVATAVSGF